MTRAKGKRMQLTQDAESLLHRSCKHVNDKNEVVIFDSEGIIRVRRPADELELRVCSELALLCLEHR